MKKLLLAAWAIGILAILLSAGPVAWAQDEAASGLDSSLLFGQIISTLVFGIIGILMAILGFKLFDWLIPFDLDEEICEKQNLAVGTLCAAMVLGICIIVAVAVI